MRHNLINTRKAKELTQAQLGKMVGLTKQSICDLEKGRVTGKPDTWDAIAKALGVKDKDQRELRKIDCSSGVKNTTNPERVN